MGFGFRADGPDFGQRQLAEAGADRDEILAAQFFNSGVIGHCPVARDKPISTVP
jgi:hypothetical protein